MAKQINEDHGEHDPSFTWDELQASMKSFNPKKAPGADGFTADICEQIMLEDPNLLLATMNKCLELVAFQQFGRKPLVGHERTANRVLSSVEKWGKNNKLKFAPHKTKAMLITNKQKFDAPKLNMGGTTIQMSDEIKILGLIIDKKLTFNNHVKTATNKAIQIYKQVARAARKGWSHCDGTPCERLIIKYENLENDEQTKIAIDKCNVQLYTDGSKIDGFVGAAYTKWIEGKEQKHKKLKLMSCCTVFQAELFAINSATEEILRCSEDSFGIFSDSRSSLDILKNGNSTHPLVTKITKNINNIKLQKKQITLYWIKAHNGLEGNERADQLAKEAAKKKAKPEYDKCPIAF
uniref:RNase H type-1 domain-containing protein n=1 Tax=Bombyx mori TaxID=7091 RepID=A0A8R2R7F5_BOMMO